MILGTKARYAVMARGELAGREEGKPVALAEIAESQEITVPYLEQIFGKLRSNGLVKSVRGPGGGYVLARSPKDIFVHDIVSAAEESLQMTRCGNSGKGCMATKTQCVTHHLWEGLEHKIGGYLKSVSLDDVRNRRFDH